MRFPIIKNKHKIGFSNLSDALRDSLQDIGIIDPKTYKLNQEYFDLQIMEGPLLGCLSKFFYLKGNFHVGCTADERPPSFGFGIGIGSSDTREGSFALGYTRILKLSTFFKNRSFRNANGNRDLEELAKAYNNIENYEEKIGISWTGWTGWVDWSSSDEPRRVGFATISLSLEFEGRYFKNVGGINHLGTKSSVGGPLYKNCTPFYQIGKGTKLSEMAEKYEENKDKLPHHHPQFMYCYNLPELGYNINDAVIGLLQIGCRIFPPKIEIAKNQDMVVKACSDYSPIPKDFDFLKENRLF